MDPTNAPKQAIPAADASHPIWEVMKAALTDKGVPSEAAMAQGVANHRPPVQPAPIQGAIPVQGLEDGGVVRSENPNTGVPRFIHTGGAVHNLLEYASDHLMGSAQRTAERETHDRVDSNVNRAVTGYADGGYVGIPTADENTRPSLTSALAIGSAMGHNVHEENLASDARDAVESGLRADPLATPTDPNAPGLVRGAIQGVAQTVMHPIQAVRHAVSSLAEYLQKPENNHDGNKQAISTNAAPPADGAPAATPSGPAIPTNAAPPASPAAVDPAGTPGNPSAAAADPAAAAAPLTPQAAASDALVKNAGAKAGVATSLQDAAAKAQANPSQPAGTKAHSLEPDFYREADARALHAAHLAARAGLDPQKVYDSSMAMVVSHMQGQVMRSYGAAYNALQMGDMKGVEKALKDANFYLPNGQDLKFMPPGPDGSLRMRNPFIGMPGHEQDQPVIDINAQSLSLMATAALHPENFHTELQSAVKLETEARKDRDLAQAKLTWSNAAQTRADAFAKSIPALNMLHTAQGNYWARKPGTTGSGSGKDPITPAVHAAVTKAATGELDNALLGPPVKIPATNPDGSMSISPSAGHTTHDETRIAPIFKIGDQPVPGDLYNEAKQWTQVVAGANARGTATGAGLTASEAAEVGMRIARYEKGYTFNEQTGQTIKSGAHAGSHMEIGKDGKKTGPIKDVVPQLDEKGEPTGILHVWMGQGRGWRDVYTRANIAEPDTAIPTGEDPSPDVNPADYAPAEDAAGGAAGAGGE